MTNRRFMLSLAACVLCGATAPIALVLAGTMPAAASALAGSASPAAFVLAGPASPAGFVLAGPASHAAIVLAGHNSTAAVVLAGPVAPAAGSPAAAAPAGPPRIDFQDVIERIEAEDLTEQETRELIKRLEGLKERVKKELTFVQRAERALLMPWVLFGFAAQFMFMMRFVIQWIASEKRKRSHIPVVFWYFSLVGGLMLLVYAVQRRDPVFILGQGLGCFIYVRNLWLIRSRRNAHRELQAVRQERNAQREARSERSSSESASGA